MKNAYLDAAPGTEGTAMRAYRYLFSLQNNDGGWGASRNDPSSVHMTAVALIALKAAPEGEDKTLAVDRGVKYLLAGQREDGGFGDIMSTVHETALAYQAIQGLRDEAEVLRKARVYLAHTQLGNGSWNDDLYCTALVLEACPVFEEERTSSAAPGESPEDQVTKRVEPVETTDRTEAVETAGADSERVVQGPRSQRIGGKISLVSRRNASASVSDVQQETTVKMIAIQSVNTDRNKYGANETVNIFSTIENRSDSVYSVLVNAQIADNRGQIVDVATHDTGPAVNLEAGVREPVTLLWNTGMCQPGAYNIRFHVADAASGSLLDERKITFAITPSVGVEELEVSVEPHQLTVEQTETLQVKASLQNRCNTEASLRMDYVVRDPDGVKVHEGAVDFVLPLSLPTFTIELPPLTHAFDKCGNYVCETSVYSGETLCSEASGMVRVASANRIDATKSAAPDRVTPDGDKQVRVATRLEGIGMTASAKLVSAKTNTTGDAITLAFDKAMADPSGNEESFAVVSGGVQMNVSQVALETPDITRIRLSLDNPVSKGQDILVSLSERKLRCVEGKSVSPFRDQVVENMVSDPILSQDGYGFSGAVPPNPLGAQIVMTAFSQWPTGFRKGNLAFTGAVCDGQHVWLVPANADSVIRIHKGTGEMTAYNQWPAGFKKGNLAFSGAIFDGSHIWLVPANADSVVRIDKDTGEMAAYAGWPEGFAKGGHAFAGGICDGESIWLVPSYADSVIRLDTASGAMQRFNEWPAGFAKGGYAFSGGVFDGRRIWMVPANADSVITVDTASGEMTRYNEWPADLGKVEYAFAGGVFDGRHVWLVPYYAERVIRIDVETGEMTGHHRRPEGLGKVEYAFDGAVFDGQSIWMVPLNADRIIRIDKDTSEVTEITDWPQGFMKGVNAFAGGVFDGENIWMVPSYADRVLRISPFSELSVSANFTANDEFYLYVSQDAFEEGTLIGKGAGASSIQSLNASLVPGVTNYIHVKCIDNKGPVAGFIGDFTLNDDNFHFSDGSRHLVTSEDHWRVYTDSFGGTRDSLTAIGKNGVGSWSTRFGIDLEANWIWTKRGTDKGMRLFSSPIYYAVVPVAPMEDVHVKEVIGGPNVVLDEESFTRKPSLLEKEGDHTIAEWHLNRFRIGQREDLHYNVVLKDPEAGQDICVSKSLEISYKDAEGNLSRREFEPTFVHVLPDVFTSSINTCSEAYRVGEDVSLACAIKNLSDLGKTVELKATIEDSQGKLIEEARVNDLAFEPGEEKAIGGIAFKLVGTSPGTHRACIVLSENQKSVAEACVEFVVEAAPVKEEPVAEAPVEAPQAEAPVEAAPVKEEPVAEAPVEAAPVKEEPVAEAPVETPQAEKPVEAAPAEDVAVQEQKQDAGVAEQTAASVPIDDLEATIMAQPSPIYQGLSETIYYTISKGEKEDLEGLQVEIVVVSPQSGETRQSFTAPATHLNNGSFAGSFTFSTARLEPGEYVTSVMVSHGPDEQKQIASTSFVVRRIDVVVT